MKFEIAEAITGALGAITGVIGGFIGGAKAAESKVATEANEAIRIAQETREDLKKHVDFYGQQIQLLRDDNEQCEKNYREIRVKYSDLEEKYHDLDTYVRTNGGIPPKPKRGGMNGN